MAGKGRTFGFYASLLVGLGYVGAAVSFLNIPAYFRPGVENFMKAFASEPLWPTLQYSSWVVVGVAGLGAVPAISRLVRTGHEEVVDWVGRVAMLGFALLAVDMSRSIGVENLLSPVFNGGNEVVRQAIVATVTPFQRLEPFEWIMAGGVGLWMFIVNYLGLKENRFPKPLAYIGFVGSLIYWIMVFAKTTQNMDIYSMVAMVAIVMAPLWFIGMGLALGSRREHGMAQRLPATGD